MRIHFICAAVISVLLLSKAVAVAEIAVSANDGKQLREGDTVSGPTLDSVSVLDINNGRARILGSVAVPAAMIGPPTSIAVARNGRFAISTACQAFVEGKLVSNDTVSVIDLSQPTRPKVIQSLHAGMGASGVSISPNGRMALVANKEKDSISVFSISGNILANIGEVQLDAGSNPTDVVFAPDGKSAVAVAQRSSKLVILTVDGIRVADTGRAVIPGRTPYGAVITRDGRYVINTNLGGATDPATADGARPRGMSRAGTISMTDLSSGTVSASVMVGPVPEHVALSADGKYVAVVVANGTAAVRSDPKFDSVLGLLEIYAVGDGTLTPVARADTGHWCQGATFSKDSRTILLQCAAEREIEVFHFDGSTLIQKKDAAMKMESRPGAIAMAWGH